RLLSLPRRWHGPPSTTPSASRKRTRAQEEAGKGTRAPARTGAAEHSPGVVRCSRRRANCRGGFGLDVLHVMMIRSFSLRLQAQPMPHHFFDFGSRKSQRKILTFRPEGEQVAIMRTAGLAGLAGRAGGQAAVPVGQVENVPVGGAVKLAEVLVVPGVVRRQSIAGPAYRTEIERLFIRGIEIRQRMPERGGVQLAPGPLGRIGT